MIRAIVLSIAVVVATIPAVARAQDSAVTGVIQQQLDAFRANDVETAFTFASPLIRRMFGNPRTFGLMVRQGYPMVWRHGDVRFLEERAQGGAVYQDVLIVDAAGVPHVLEYMMIPVGDGWQINGVRMLAAPPVGA